MAGAQFSARSQHRAHQHADADHPQTGESQHRSVSTQRTILHSAHLHPALFLRTAGRGDVPDVGRLLLVCRSGSDSLECFQGYEKRADGTWEKPLEDKKILEDKRKYLR